MPNQGKQGWYNLVINEVQNIRQFDFEKIASFKIVGLELRKRQEVL